MQAGILAAAGILSRLIGLLYRSPLTAIIGAEGMGYYQMAYNIYTMILLISSYSIPSAISKVIAQKLAWKEYRNAHRIYRTSLWYVLLVGTAAGLVLFFGGPYLVEGEAAAKVLKVFAPTVFLSGILGVMRGYFQAHKSMLQTSVSQIVEQLINAAVSILAAVLLIRAVLGTLEWKDAAFNSSRSMYGAAGSAVGTTAGVLFALLFMWGVYALNRPLIRRRIDRDRSERQDTYGDIFRMIMGVVTPFILSTAVYNLSAALNQTIYSKILRYWREVSAENISYYYGILSEAVTISNIPIAFASAMAAAMIPAVTQYAACKDWDKVREKIQLAVKTTMIISIPCAAGLCILAKPVVMLLYPQADTVEMASRLLMVLAVSVIFYALSTLSNSCLQGMGKTGMPIFHAGVALALQTPVAALLLLFTQWNLFALALANIVYSLTICILNQLSLRKVVGYRQQVWKTFLIPLLAAGFMGGLAWAAYEGLHLLTGANAVSLGAAVVLGAAAYFALLILLRGLTEEELRGFPKGRLLVKAAKKCRLLK